MQKNTVVMGKMGISTIDIERLTAALLESNNNGGSNLNSAEVSSNTILVPAVVNEKNKGKKEGRDGRDGKEGKEGKDSREKAFNNLEIKSVNSPLPVDVDELEKGYDSKQIQFRDIHKFLFELWNEREIDIVINLYREMETKQQGAESQHSGVGLGCSPSGTIERNYIYNNIMQYCEMKENKLYKYIEQNSSVL
jgi:hypothetical protein